MKRDFIAELISVARNVVTKCFIPIVAFAEEPSDDSAGGAGDGADGGDGEDSHQTVNYEDLIAKARKDEKAKQYKTIEKLRKDLKTMTENNNSNLIRIGELEKENEELNKKLTSTNTGDSEAVKTLREELATAQSKLETAESELKKLKESEVDESALRTQIENEVKAEYEVKNYRLELLAKNQDIIVPELITGTTKEELDASLETAKARSEQIRQQLGITTSQTQQTNTGSAFSNRMPAVSSPSAGSATATVSFEDLAKLNPASPEYAEMRKKLGLH